MCYFEYKEENRMNAIEVIANDVEKLSPKELAKFRNWFLSFDSDVWDGQIEADAAAGKLDVLAEDAIAEYNAGKAREI